VWCSVFVMGGFVIFWFGTLNLYVNEAIYGRPYASRFVKDNHLSHSGDSAEDNGNSSTHCIKFDRTRPTLHLIVLNMSN
jgi:hypothetical protein